VTNGRMDWFIAFFSIFFMVYLSHHPYSYRYLYIPSKFTTHTSFIPLRFFFRWDGISFVRNPCDRLKYIHTIGLALSITKRYV
jgi:hypothetical protein